MQDEAGGSGLTVLVVEDEPDLREAVCEAMKDAGYHLIGVGDLELARAALARTPIDLLLLDVLVNGATCDALLNELSLGPRAPATVLTSADATQRSRDLAHRYALPLILKPFDLDDLVRVLATAHERHQVPTIHR